MNNVVRKKDVIRFFEETYGDVDEASIVDIVSASPTRDIQIHIVRHSRPDGSVTLFTTGLSDVPIECPVPEGQDKFAELYIQLPPNWEISNLSNAENYWPVVWLKGLAHTFCEPETWLDDFTVYQASQPIAAHLKFDSFLIISDQEFVDSTGAKVDLSRLVPIFPNERELESKEGLPALLVAMDEANVPMVVAPERASAVQP